jgi:hypothetical protein
MTPAEEEGLKKEMVEEAEKTLEDKEKKKEAEK